MNLGLFPMTLKTTPKEMIFTRLRLMECPRSVCRTLVGCLLYPSAFYNDGL